MGEPEQVSVPDGLGRRIEGVEFSPFPPYSSGRNATFLLTCGHVRLGKLERDWEQGSWWCLRCGGRSRQAVAARLGWPTRFKGKRKISRERFEQLQLNERRCEREESDDAS